MPITFQFGNQHYGVDWQSAVSNGYITLPDASNTILKVESWTKSSPGHPPKPIRLKISDKQLRIGHAPLAFKIAV